MKLTKEENAKLINILAEYETQYEQGFTEKEIKDIMETYYPSMNMIKFNDAMMGNTCMTEDNDEIINYHVDVLTAFRAGLESRDTYPHEFD